MIINGPPLAIALAQAARTVAQVASGGSLTEHLSRLKDEGQTPRGALLDLTHGTLRRYGRTQAIVRMLSRRERPDNTVAALLWCAIYALECGRYREFTVVDQAVHACSELERAEAKGYVNALLRRYLRERLSIETRVRSDVEAFYCHPRWWIDMLRRAYPQGWQDILAADNSHPPMALRVNRRRIAREEYLKLAKAAGLIAKPIGDTGLILEQPVPTERLPGFSDGLVSVQDFGAQRAPQCLDLAPGQRILDACAAPGGKCAHILESADVALTALDFDAQRASHIGRNLERLHLDAEVRVADCTRIEAWWDGRRFDRILADVPCSSSGVARRHPDVKWLRRMSDISGFAARQRAILDALWRVLVPGGKLLYLTCSVFPQENEELVQAFLARADNACRLPLPDGAPSQWLPGPQHDGFFYALIQKLG